MRPGRKAGDMEKLRNWFLAPIPSLIGEDRKGRGSSSLALASEACTLGLFSVLGL